MKTGTPKFDGVAVAEGTFSFLNMSATLECQAAFVNSSTGGTHGWTKGSGAIWSAHTIDLLKALRESMEQDLVNVHMVSADGAATETSAGPATKGTQASGGLSEFLLSGDGDAPPM